MVQDIHYAHLYELQVNEAVDTCIEQGVCPVKGRRAEGVAPNVTGHP